MVYLLEFKGSLYEFNGSFGKTAKALKEIEKSMSRTMMLHRYDLGFWCWNKHQCKDPDRLVFDKLVGDRLLLMHLSVYKEFPEKIVPLIEYCEENGIDLIAPVSDGTPTYTFKSTDPVPGYQMTISGILKDREHVLYDFTDTGSTKNFDAAMDSMMRDLKLRNLFK